MEFRVINDMDRPQVEELWNYCFEKREEPFFQYYFNHYCYEQNVVWGAFQEGKLQSMLHLNPYTMWLRGSLQSVPYVVGVATAEEARGKHLMGELLEASLASLRRQGTDFVYLMPIYAGIYLPYGFSFCYERLEYSWEMGKLSLPNLVKAKEGYSFTEGAVAEAVEHLGAVLGPVYDRYIAHNHGAPTRAAMDWEKLLGVYAGDGFRYVLVEKAGETVGYLLYGLQENAVELVELIAMEQETKLALLAYAESLEVAAKRCHYLAEAWDKTYLDMYDASQAPKKLPFMMARCTNVLGALGKLKAPAAVNGSVVLRVEDKLLQENCCTVAIKAAADELKVEQTEELPDISMDIAAFTQMYFGLVCADELFEAGKLACGDKAKLQLLDALLPKTKNWLNEYY